MPLPGEGFLALWNDVAEDRVDYDAWHTIEHVPERMTVDGFLRACRYVRTRGEMPSYFTLYAIGDLTALASPAYIQIVAEPTPWSRGMRPDMFNFIRRICRTQVTLGGGVGGFMAITPLSEASGEAVAALCNALSVMRGVTGVHHGVVDPAAHELKITVQRGELPFEPHAFLIVEGYDEQALEASCAQVEGGGVADWSYYKLAFEIRQEDLRTMTFPTPRRRSGPGTKA